MASITVGDYPLTSKTLASLTTTFQKHHHEPSAEMWTALEALVKNLEDQANGRAEAREFLSSLDPGVGKTTAIKLFIKELLASKDHDHVGVLLCFGRIAEIESIFNSEDMGLSKEDICVWTSKDTVNEKGRAESARSARVLITTQQRIEKIARPSHHSARSGPRNFAECSELFFQFMPRQVLVWDESFLPCAAIDLDRDSIAQLVKPLRRRFPDHAEALDKLNVETMLPRGAKPKSIIFPDLESINPNISLPDLLTALPDSSGPVREPNTDGVSEESKHTTQAGADKPTAVLVSCWAMSGRPVVVQIESHNRAVVSYNQVLPSDFSPLLITDASGRV